MAASADAGRDRLEIVGIAVSEDAGRETGCPFSSSNCPYKGSFGDTIYENQSAGKHEVDVAMRYM